MIANCRTEYSWCRLIYYCSDEARVRVRLVRGRARPSLQCSSAVWAERQHPAPRRIQAAADVACGLTETAIRSVSIDRIERTRTSVGSVEDSRHQVVSEFTRYSGSQSGHTATGTRMPYEITSRRSNTDAACIFRQTETRNVCEKFNQLSF